MKELESKILNPDFWNDKNKAKKIMVELDNLNNTYKLWHNMSVRVKDLIDLKELAAIEKDENLLKDVEDGSRELEKELS
ncbi:MAG: PCRF domain-containing protein, partial [Endomicrobium sp.]|nr:PCRF domain-containing protein [Endomicrobium sp.]